MQDPNLVDDLDDVVIKPRSKVPLFVFLALLLGGAGALVWSLMTAVEPTRVLVAIEFDGHWFEGSKPAARIADGLNTRLEALGFIPVTAGEPEVDAVLTDKGDDLVAAARSLKAAFVIGGTLRKTVHEHPIDGGYFEVRLAGDVTVQHVDDEGEPAGAPVGTWAGDRTLEAAIDRLVGRTLDRKIAAAALPNLVGHASIQALIKGDVSTAGTLRPARDYVATQGRQKRTFAEAYAALAKRRLAAEKGPAKPTYHRELSGADGLCGSSAAGALIKTADVEPYVSDRTGKLSWIDRYETVAWFHPEHGARTLWEGYNVYSYPGASADGRVVAWVEDLLGWAKTVTVQVADAPAQRLVIDPKKRFSKLEPSAKGTYVALYERACRECHADVVVYAVADGAEVRRFERHGGTFDGFAWVNDDTLLILHTPEFKPAEGEGDEGETPPAPFAAEGQTVWTSTVTTPDLEAVHTVSEGLTLSWPQTNRAGTHAVFAARGPLARGLAVVELGGGALQFHETPQRAVNPTFSPDGAWIAFSTGYRKGEEIAVMATTGGAVRPLTKNRVRDRYPWFSADGTRVWYETLDDDPNFPRKRRVSVLSSVPFTP